MARLLLWGLVAALAPAAAQPAAPVTGYRADIDRLAGEWAGAYACDETGRHGTVAFRLQAGADSVWATVLMTPRAADGPPPAAIPLRIHAVEITGASFRGSLDAYDDPEWGLPLETEFAGALVTDDRIEGSFRGAGTRIDTVPQCGRWWATRSAAHPQPPAP